MTPEEYIEYLEKRIAAREKTIQFLLALVAARFQPLGLVEKTLRGLSLITMILLLGLTAFYSFGLVTSQPPTWLMTLLLTAGFAAILFLARTVGNGLTIERSRLAAELKRGALLLAVPTTTSLILTLFWGKVIISPPWALSWLLFAGFLWLMGWAAEKEWQQKSGDAT